MSWSTTWFVLRLTIRLLLFFTIRLFSLWSSSWGHSWYHKVSNIRHTESQNWNVSRLSLQLSLRNILKPSVKLRMKMWLDQRRQVMLQLHLSDQQFNCLLKCPLYYRLDSKYLEIMSMSVVAMTPHLVLLNILPVWALGPLFYKLATISRWHFFFKCIFLNENVGILIKISLKFVLNGPLKIFHHYTTKLLGGILVSLRLSVRPSVPHPASAL